MYVCMYVYTYVYTHVRTYVCVYILYTCSILAPLLYVAMRDPEHGLRDTMFDRELHVASTGHDDVEAQAAAMFISFCSQLLRHWELVEASGCQDVPRQQISKVLYLVTLYCKYSKATDF
jgi:hypothetical protein